MSLLSTIAVNFGRVATFIQVLFYLPLALDIAGQDAFLALSASLASYYLFLSTIRLATRGTRLAWIGQTLAVFQFVVIPACLLVCCNVYSPPSATIFPPRRSGSEGSECAPSDTVSGLFGASAHLDASTTGSGLLDSLFSSSVRIFFYLARRVPGWWYALLRMSSPFFSLLEGVASLLVIQSLASTSRWIIASSLTSPPSTWYQSNKPGVPNSSANGSVRPGQRTLWISNTLMRPLASLGFGASEVWQILFLLVSATIYVSAAMALYVSFEGATRDRPGTAAAIATSVTSTVWLTSIAFAIRKGNVIETSLMFAYVVFNIYQLGPSLSFTADPISLIRSFKVNTHGASFVKSLPSSLQSPLPSRILQSVGTLIEVLAHWLGQSFDFLSAAGAALPKSVIVSLIYRLMVLYAASRILPTLKGSVSLRHGEGLVKKASWGKVRQRSHDDAARRTQEEADKWPKEGGEWSSETESQDGPEDQDDPERIVGLEHDNDRNGVRLDHLTGSDSDGESGHSEVEEYEEEVWDEDEGRWILQKRRRTIRRRRTRRRNGQDGHGRIRHKRHHGGGGEVEEEVIFEEYDSDQDDEGIQYLEDDSGIAYNEEDKQRQQLGSKKGSDERRQPSSRLYGGASALDKPKQMMMMMMNKARSRNKRPSSLRSRPSVARMSRKRKTPRYPGSRPLKRYRFVDDDDQDLDKDGGQFLHEDEEEEQDEPFGSFISILVSYSRLILIAVYSHLLLLDQKNQIYWRFLTVGLTLTLWGLELVISKEDEVEVNASGGILAR